MPAAGIGLTISYAITIRTGNFFLGFIGAGLVAAAVGIAVGIPAVRSRGLMAAVSTLSFALVTQTWLLQQSWALGSGVFPGRPIIGSFRLDTGKRYYFLTLALLVVAVWLCRNVWRGGLGRSFSALRDNHDAARAFCVPATRRQVEAFAVAGFVAGVGGAVFGHALANVSFQNFPVGRSIDVVAITVIGGLGLLAGPIVGAFYVIGLPAFVALDSLGAAATAAGWLVLILYFPGGLPMPAAPLRDRLLDALARRAGIDPEARAEGPADPQTLTDISSQVRVGASPEEGRPVPASAPEDRPVVLDVRDMRKAFGGVQAVDGVSFTVRAGETMGLIGPNGAGKTTLFELVSGFTPADRGRVLFGGVDVTSMAPEARGRLGLIRSFQDAYLFPTLTVLDTVRLAHERRHPTRLLPDLLGLRGTEREKDAHARELVALMGLERYADTPIGELSTGTRRITELACLLALEPSVLLLDEPSSGVAQRETEALGRLLATVRDHLRTTLVIIEHDLQLVAGLSDTMLAMANGRIVAAGPPELVLRDDEVARSYIGSDEAAIHRSGSLAPAVVGSVSGNGAGRRRRRDDGRCRSETRSGTRCSRSAVVEGLCRQHAELVR
jgi:ABC-type branched-subunit amino acid transport system ATPase component/ABC-type branched-subunit amino acid transport system permease subunit